MLGPKAPLPLDKLIEKCSFLRCVHFESDGWMDRSSPVDGREILSTFHPQISQDSGKAESIPQHMGFKMDSGFLGIGIDSALDSGVEEKSVKGSRLIPRRLMGEAVSVSINLSQSHSILDSRVPNSHLSDECIVSLIKLDQRPHPRELTHCRRPLPP